VLREQCRHARQLGPRALGAEVGGEAEVNEGLGHLKSQLGEGGEAHLESKERRGDPEARNQRLGRLHPTPTRRALAPARQGISASRNLHPDKLPADRDQTRNAPCERGCPSLPEST
jgi:hypothetical protein